MQARPYRLECESQYSTARTLFSECVKDPIGPGGTAGTQLFLNAVRSLRGAEVDFDDDWRCLRYNW